MTMDVEMGNWKFIVWVMGMFFFAYFEFLNLMRLRDIKKLRDDISRLDSMISKKSDV